MEDNYVIQIKLLTETKPIVCLPWEIHYKVSRENPEAGGSNPGSGSRFSFEIL